MERIKLVQMNIYQSKAYRKDLYWPRFDDNPRVQEKQWAWAQQSYIPISVAYPTNPSSS